MIHTMNTHQNQTTTDTTTDYQRRLWHAVGCLFLTASCLITLGALAAAVICIL